jgi:hypothetical protein
MAIDRRGTLMAFRYRIAPANAIAEIEYDPATRQITRYGRQP